MPGALVTDEMGLRKTFTLVAAVMICTLLTEKVVMGLPLSIVWGNMREEWVNMVQNDVPGIISDEPEWYPLQRHNSVPHHFIEIQKTPPEAHPVLTFVLDPLLVVTMAGVTEIFKSVINEMTLTTGFKLINLLYVENVILTQEDLNTNLDKPEN